MKIGKSDDIKLSGNTDTLENLFASWKIEHNNEPDSYCKLTFPRGITSEDFKKSFCKDGPLSAEEGCFEAKILFICRESNVGDSPETEDRFWIKDIVNEKPGQNPTEKRCATKFITCMSEIAEVLKVSFPKDCAYMNINKRGGKSSSSAIRLNNYFYRYLNYIFEEIRLINPEYIILLGKLPSIESELKTNFSDKKVFTYPRHPSVYSRDALDKFKEELSQNA